MSKKQADKEFIVEARITVFTRSEDAAKRKIVQLVGGKTADFVIDRITDNGPIPGDEVKP
ncbi:MAG: hypothetical protein WC350_06240 [Candidatus Micrarchaeia archaeon]